MGGSARRLTTLAAVAASAALAVAGCGGGDEDKPAAQPPPTTESTASEAAPPPPAAEGGEQITLEDAKAAFEAEGHKTNETGSANSFLEPKPEWAFSLVSPDTGTVAHGSVAGYKTAADAKKAAANSEKSSGDDLDNLTVSNVLIQHQPEPFDGFPTAEKMKEIAAR